MSTRSHVLILEPTASHTELLDTQVAALQVPEVRCTVFTGEESGWFPRADHTVTHQAFPGMRRDTRKAWLQRVLRYIDDQQVQTVMLNTAHGTFARQLASRLWFRPRVRLVGITHEVNKHLQWGTQRLIDLRMRHHLLLTRSAMEYAAHRLSGRSTWFYAIDHQRPLAPADAAAFQALETQLTGKRVVIVPGIWDRRRRALDALFDALDTYTHPDLQIVMAGNARWDDGPELSRRVRVAPWAAQVIWFEEFLSPGLFSALMLRADALLPLIHPEVAYYNTYPQSKISGAFHLSYASGVPLLLEEQIAGYPDFQGISLPYSTARLGSLLSELCEHPAALSAVRDALQQSPFRIAEGHYARIRSLLLE